MTRPCKVGVQLPEVERSVPWPEYLDLARQAELVGFDSIWVGDHLIYDLPDGSTRGPYEAWTTLAAVAAVTERLELGPLVASTSFHAPAMLAKHAATVDAISQGRLILGLGAGWNRREFDAFGFPYDRRVSRFEEALAIIAPLLRDGRTTFHGQFYDVDDCVLDPTPVREGGPRIMLGSTSPRMLRIGLPVVDSWNAWWSIYDNSVERFAALKAEVDAVMPEGRVVEATAAVLVTLPGGRGRLMGESYDARVTTVSPDELCDHVRGLSDAGVTHLQLVLDPITTESIDTIGAVLEDLGSSHPQPAGSGPDDGTNSRLSSP
jgi:alkanesulfonate monooxygenase SsuD/methylene tetrahydromethanopterin reductase-like flavin-dependent oxidoreductase (luciferase family)